MDWAEVTPKQELQQLLYRLYEETDRTTHQAIVQELEDWVADNVDGCALMVRPGRGPVWGDGGIPPEYCENLASPDSEEGYCSFHEGVENGDI